MIEQTVRHFYCENLSTIAAAMVTTTKRHEV